MESTAVLKSYMKKVTLECDLEQAHEHPPPACNGGALLKGWRAAIKDKNRADVIEQQPVHMEFPSVSSALVDEYWVKGGQ